MERAYYLELNFVLKIFFVKTFICNLIPDWYNDCSWFYFMKVIPKYRVKMKHLIKLK